MANNIKEYWCEKCKEWHTDPCHNMPKEELLGDYDDRRGI